jgi:hypothetical protein
LLYGLKTGQTADWFLSNAAVDLRNWQAGPNSGRDPSTIEDVKLLAASLGKSAALSGWAQGIQPGDNASGTPQPQPYMTPDGHAIDPNSNDYSYYQMVDGIWQKLYFSHAPWSVVETFKAQHITDAAQAEAILNEMPSHIPGWSIGTYDSVKAAAEKIAAKNFGRPIPDSLMKDFAAKGISTPAQVSAWFMQHPSKDIPKEDYQAVFDAALPYANGTFNSVPHPDQVHYLYTQAAPTAATTPDPNQPDPASQAYQNAGQPTRGPF